MDKNRCKKKHIRFSKPLKTLPMLEMKWFVKLREVKIHTSFLVKFFLVATIRQKMLKIISVNIDCKVSNFKRRQQPNGSYWVSKDVFFSKLLSSGDWKCFFIVKNVSKNGWQTSRRHKGQIFVDKKGEFSCTLLVNSHGHFCPRKFLFLGEFLRTFSARFSWTYHKVASSRLVYY